MTMRLTVLGGAAAWPNPGQGCSSYLVQESNAQILLDCGPDTLLELRKYLSLDTLTAIFISHCHADHILDLITLRYALVYSPEQPAAPVPLWVPPGGIAVLDNLARALGSQGESMTDFWREVFDMQEYDPATTKAVGGVCISFAPTQHFTSCYALRLDAEDGKSIVYGADTGNVDGLVEFSGGASVLISEATADSHAGVDREDRGHLTPEDAGEWAARSGAERLLITHLWHERDSVDVVERVRRRYDGPIAIASPGLVIDA